MDIIIDGALFYGDGYGAGGVGHQVVIEEGEACACGNRGCLETVASTRTVVQRAREIMSDDLNPQLRGIASTPAEINTETLLQAFKAGDPALRGLIMEAGKHPGGALASQINVLNTTHIVIAGSMACFGDALLEAIKEQMGTPCRFWPRRPRSAPAPWGRISSSRARRPYCWPMSCTWSEQEVKRFANWEL